MIKKILGLLFLPYFAFMFLEGCFFSDSQCDRRETRNITNIKMLHTPDTYSRNESIVLKMEYESFFVSNFRLDILPKAYARKEQKIDPCFEGFSNPILVMSIISSHDFDTNHLAGSEFNSLFSHNYSDKNLNEFDLIPQGYYDNFSDKIQIYNDTIPSLDSIHTLYFKIYCADGKTYLDTLPNVNLNRTNQSYYY